jgi:hypothetical protein
MFIPRLGQNYTPYVNRQLGIKEFILEFGGDWSGQTLLESISGSFSYKGAHGKLLWIPIVQKSLGGLGRSHQRLRLC